MASGLLSSPSSLPSESVPVPVIIQLPSEAAEYSLPAPERVSRASAGVARQRIQDTLEWENCDENSNRFQAVAQQFEDDFNGEHLEDGEIDEISASESCDSASSSDGDESYESSFVTDGSGTEEEDSEDEWTPVKRVCSHAEATLKPSGHTTTDQPEGPPKASDDACVSAASMLEENPCNSTEPDVPAPESPQTPSYPADTADLANEAGRLHAEEPHSPAGFYNQWVL